MAYAVWLLAAASFAVMLHHKFRAISEMKRRECIEQFFKLADDLIHMEGMNPLILDSIDDMCQTVNDKDMVHVMTIAVHKSLRRDRACPDDSDFSRAFDQMPKETRTTYGLLFMYYVLSLSYLYNLSGWALRQNFLTLLQKGLNKLPCASEAVAKHVDEHRAAYPLPPAA